jgi:hypothetical protein
VPCYSSDVAIKGYLKNEILTLKGDNKMSLLKFKAGSVFLVFGVLLVIASIPAGLHAQSPAVDEAATQILQRMTTYLGKLRQFSVHTQTNFEDELDSGHRVDFDISATVLVSRPNKVHAERKGDLVDQSFYYDGKTLTLYNPSEKAYATEPAPGTIEEMLDFASESLGLIIPVADLVYRNAFPLLMQDVTLAVVVGKSAIGGVSCDHLLFSRPGVDFQVWVADSGHPMPYKYVVSDTGTPSRLSISTTMSDWNVSPSVNESRFTFTPPEGAELISFMPL